MTTAPVSRLQRRIAAWLCLAAMLMIALAPAVSRALERPHCPPGAVHLAMASEELRHGTEMVAASGVLDHCGYCVLFGAPFGLIAAEVPRVEGMPTAERSVRAPTDSAIVAGPRHGAAQPRAPPPAA